MTIDWEESWLLLKNEWVGHDLDPTTCNTQGYYEITTSDVVAGSDHAMIELLTSTCFSGFKITNKANAEKIIINLQDHDVKFNYNLQIEGNKANVTIIGTKEILFKDVITENINKLTYINGLYQGIDPHTNKIQYNHGNNGVWINNLKCQTIGLSSSKVVLAGNIEVDAYILIKLEGTGADGYKLDTQKLLSLSTNILKIVDNKSGHGINLCGNVSANEIIIEPGNYLLLSNGQLIAQTILIAAHPTIDMQGNVDIASSLKATEIQIRVNNLRVQNTGEIKTVDFQIDANTIKAKAIRIITKETFLMNGLVIAKNDSIFYHAESFSSSGISVSLSHLRLTAKHSIQIDAANPEVIKRWQAGLSQPSEEPIANLLSLSGAIFLNATTILLSRGAQIINIGQKTNDSISGRIAITASSYIYHDASIIIANSNIVEEANGQNTEGFGVILENNAQVISISGYVKITTQANTKLGGTFIGSEGVFLYTACLHTTAQSLILSEHANTKIKITNCEFFNYGSIGSNKLLDITVTGGHFENHNLLVGAEQIELIVHDRKDFTSYGQIHSEGDARFGLWAGASVIFKPGSLTQVGSYHIEHFSGDASLNIGIVDCHGCEIITTTNADSVIRATMFVARLTHYQKLATEIVAEKTFLYEHQKEMEGIVKLIGMVVNYAILCISGSNI